MNSLSFFFVQDTPIIHLDTIYQRHWVKIGFVCASLSREDKYECTTPVFKSCGTFCPKNLMAVVAACRVVFWNLFDRWLVTVCQFSSVSLVFLPSSRISFILFDLPLGSVGEGKSCCALPITRRFFAQAIVDSINKEGNWFEKEIVKSRPKIAVLKKKSVTEGCIFINHSEKVANILEATTGQ